MNDEAARHGRPDNPITCSQRTAWPRCEACGQRAPTGELLDRHRLRRCVGPVEGRHAVTVRLTPAERSEFVQTLRRRTAA